MLYDFSRLSKVRPLGEKKPNNFKNEWVAGEGCSFPKEKLSMLMVEML